ncbi:MAG: DUF2007 domain-containing protein [bacterium]|nr:DUF2007 domain-containing protein [bacterium]
MAKNSDQLVTVLATSNPFLIPLAKSLLDDADIPYLTRGETLQGLGLGQAFGPIEIQVLGENIEEARTILEDLEE